MSESYATRVNAHYNRSDHYEAILEWLRGQGKDLAALTVEDLAPVDQFHGGRLASTQGLAAQAGVSADLRVADLGGGLGGPARYLAATYGCRVDVADLSTELCRVGELLTGLVHLEARVHFTCASATASGLPDGAYDIVWMQNAAMNIEDRPALYREVARLLKPGGFYVFQEILAGDAGPAYYPMNWASTQAESFLQRPESVLLMLLDGGFRVLYWQDETEVMKKTRQTENVDRLAGTAPPNYLSVEVLRQAALNGNKAIAEGRLRFGRGIFQKL
jgi:SAM-dependent methyltransferase